MSEPATPRHWLDPADLAVGLGGALVIAAPELVVLGRESSAAAVVALVLFATLGLVVGAALALGELVARRMSRASTRALARALPSLFATIPLAQTLFEGAFATTLPGAASAPVWLPIASTIGLAIVIAIAGRLVAVPRRGVLLAIALALGVVLVDLVNRRAYRTEYPDVHTFLLVCEAVAAGLALRLLATAWGRPWPRPDTRSLARGRVACAAISISFVLVLHHGLQEASARATLATSGMHGRMLVRLARGLGDFDGDGHSHVLGGGDCDDHDDRAHPGAREIDGNGIDEDCDGIDGLDAVAQEIVREREERQAELEVWRDSGAAKGLLARTKDMNVVLLAIDALRADVLADTAQNRNDFPTLFALLDESRQFTHAFAPSAGTDLSMSGVLTGQVDPWSTAAPTLAEAFSAQGRRTHAVIPSEVIRYVGKSILTRGLDDYDRLVNDMYERDVGSYTTGARTTELGLRFVDDHLAQHASQSFFLWLHYFDVHEHHEVKLGDRRLKDLAAGQGELDKLGKYRLLVRLVDRELASLVAALRERNLWDRTIIVLLSDHGEGLGEHPRLPDNHGRFVYNALVHVPLAFRIPGVSPARLEQPVSLLDVHPTLVQLAGATPPSVAGESLLPMIADDVPPHLRDRTRPLPLNETDQYGVVLWPYKLLVRRAENLPELYDLGRDFGELEDLAAKDPQRVAALRSAYAALPSVEIDRTRKGRRDRDRLASEAEDGAP